jgi:ABC-type multidrug transport system fused ATPase/permease subunit
MSNPPLSPLLHRLWSHVSPRRRAQFGLLFLVMIFTSFAEVVSIGAVLPFLGVLTAPDRIFGSPIAQPLIHFFGFTEPKQLLLPLTIIFATSALLSGAMRLILLWIQTRLSQALGADFSLDIYRKTLYQPYAVHVSRNSSEVIAAVRGKANSLVSHTLFPIMVIASSSMMLLAIMIALLAVEATIATIAFSGFGIIYVIVVKSTKNSLARNSQRVNLESVQVIKSLQEGLGGIRDVLIDGTQDSYCTIYSRADLPYRRAEANIQIISNFPRYGIEAIGMVLIAALAYSMVGRSGGILHAIPVLGALAIGAQRLLPVVQQAYSSWSMIRGGQASMGDALDLLDQPFPAYAGSPAPLPIPFQHSITFSNLAFKYTNSAPWVLQHGFNLNITKGDRIGFIGSTGSGKSTLLDLIMGLLQPTVGSFAIDGVVVTEQNRRGWQAHIAHVPQAIFLADASIAENIAFGTPVEKIDFARMQQSAQKAQIATTIEAMDEKYNSLVGEQGVRLSGGQRQRIGIARALYKQADVIVFDEATSALDSDTELAVMDAIENLGEELTVIMVAHRLSTLKKCTQIVELADGKIVRIGDYQNIVEHAPFIV